MIYSEARLQLEVTAYWANDCSSVERDRPVSSNTALFYFSNTNFSEPIQQCVEKSFSIRLKRPLNKAFCTLFVIQMGVPPSGRINCAQSLVQWPFQRSQKDIFSIQSCTLNHSAFSLGDFNLDWFICNFGFFELSFADIFLTIFRLLSGQLVGRFFGQIFDQIFWPGFWPDFWLGFDEGFGEGKNKNYKYNVQCYPAFRKTTWKPPKA